MKNIYLILAMALLGSSLAAQPCSPAGDETTYGSGDTWIGYLYDNMDFTAYRGFVNEGTAGNPNFDENFGGDYVNYPTSSCTVYTEGFSARYKLTKTFTPGNYQFIVGADDGYRLSIDGGATWIIDRFFDQWYNFTAYSTTLSGTYNIVLEYYENAGGNRISFSVANACTPTGDESLYGTANTWNGYIYQGTNFNIYNGTVTEGNSSSPNFNENFGGNNTLYATNTCLVPTEVFSARYRLQKTFASGNYIFTVGADDGYRLSLDGGSTWVIDHWWDQGYNTATYSTNLSGTYNMVLEYYENTGGNQVSFDVSLNTLLPVQLLGFNGKLVTGAVQLDWQITSEINTGYYQVERSFNGTDFSTIGTITAGTAVTNAAGKSYAFVDASPLSGINYYRLHMVDKDGRSANSAVIKLVYNQRKSITFFPTLVNHSGVQLQTDAEIKNGSVEMFEMTGQKIQAIQLPGTVAAGQIISLPLPVNRPGTYVLICRTASTIKAKQIIIIP